MRLQAFPWKNCCGGWSGQFKGDGNGHTVILEAVCDHRRHIWHCHFGEPGSLNDIKVPDKSSIVGVLVSGDSKILSSNPHSINGNMRDWKRFLVDGIHPESATSVNAHSHPQKEKKKKFAKPQERVRKDTE